MKENGHVEARSAMGDWFERKGCICEDGSDVDVGALLAVKFAVESRWGIGVIPWLGHQHLRCSHEYEAGVKCFSHDLSNLREVANSIFAKVRSVAITAKYGTRDRRKEVTTILNVNHHQRRKASVLCALCGKGKKAGRR